MSGRKARVAVIGTGWWSTYTHIPGLQAQPDAELVAICDRSQEMLRKTADTYGPLSTYTDFQDMIRQERLDGVVIATEPGTHYELANACLEAGLHVMLEKPMVLQTALAHELVNLANNKGVALIIGYPWHYTENTRKAREVLGSGVLGTVQFLSCVFASMAIEFYRDNPEAYREVFDFPVTNTRMKYSGAGLTVVGGQGHEQITHSAGSLLYVTGLQADSVSAYMDNCDVLVDVVDAIAVRFKSVDGQIAVGVIGSTGNLGVGDNDQLDIRIYCEKGYIILNQVQGTLHVRHHDGREEQYGPLPEDDRYPRFATAKNLTDVILGQAENGSPGELGARVVEILDAAYRSAAANGNAIRIDEL